MGEPVVELRGIGKRYRLGEHLGGATDLKEAMAGRFWQLMGRAPARREDFWALRDVDLTVAAGESLGVVGRNGAGKSTLLKIVAGVTTPTEGVSRTRGRIGSLLEIGTGFNDELTGRENTFLSGAILGMRRREVAARLDEIVAFAGLDDFVDTPVKRYSSGMYLRLAFAVAAHLEADILLVDEVLAVGDAEFRRKCLAKMSEVESTGRTVLFASHNHEALIELCSKAVWFDEGRVAASGPAATTVREYLSTTAAPGRTVDLPVGDGNERATLRAAARCSPWAMRSSSRSKWTWPSPRPRSTSASSWSDPAARCCWTRTWPDPLTMAWREPGVIGSDCICPRC